MLCTTCTLVSMRKPLVLLICAVAAGIAVAVGVGADAVCMQMLCVLLQFVLMLSLQKLRTYVADVGCFNPL